MDRCTEPSARRLAAGLRALLLVAAGVTLGSFALASNGGSSEKPFYATEFEKSPSIDSLTALGAALFRDPALSASHRLSCANCHDPLHAFGPASSSPVQRGGASGREPGLRAVPSLMYLESVPPFTEHFVDDDGDDSVDQGPAGGRTWDGRAPSVHDQARLPLFSPFEMANSSVAALVAELSRSQSAARFRDTFGQRVFADEGLAFRGVLLALETYQQKPDEFYPYTSKYDAWLRRQATLTAAEERGMAVFNDPAKGNCARCHISASRSGAFPLFTDFGFAAIGVPRNEKIPANADDKYFDLGLCGPLRTDLQGRNEYCGLFRTPTLRNVGLRPVFFHNGAFIRLEDAVRFYAQRDTAPGRYYPHAPDGRVKKFDDLPAQYDVNLDRETPFDRKTGEKPALSAADVHDVVAFLETLTDGYSR